MPAKVHVPQFTAAAASMRSFFAAPGLLLHRGTQLLLGVVPIAQPLLLWCLLVWRQERRDRIATPVMRT